MSTAAADTRPHNSPWRVQAVDIAYIAVFAALVAALALAPQIMLPFGVPITLQTLGVSLAGLCLGPLRGFLSMLLFVTVGAAGLPVFSGGRAGLTIITSTPTGGYLISFPLCAFVTGLLAWWIVRRGLDAMTPVLFFLAVAVPRIAVMWPIAAWGMARTGNLSFSEALVADTAFWVGDAIKAVVAALLALAVHKAFPRLLR